MNESDINRKTLKDNVYMSMADEIAKLSRDKNTKIGCVIVAEDGTPVSWGYNGTLSGVMDCNIPHSRDLETVQYIKVEVNSFPSSVPCYITTNKYPWMRHAERNAIKFADRSKLKGATLYVNAYPCESCALEIADSGIRRVVIRTTQMIDVNSSINNDRTLSEAIFAQKHMTLTVDGNDMQLVPMPCWVT